jgi:hypothetical protein
MSGQKMELMLLDLTRQQVPHHFCLFSTSLQLSRFEFQISIERWIGRLLNS